MNSKVRSLTAIVASFTLLILGSQPASATPRTNEKVTICHRTHATTNPYRQITVSMSSIVGNGNSGNGHGDTTPGGGQDDPDVTADHSHNPYLTELFLPSQPQTVARHHSSIHLCSSKRQPRHIRRIELDRRRQSDLLRLRI